MNVAVFGALGLEAVVGSDDGLNRVHRIGSNVGFVVEIEIQERPLRARGRRFARRPT